MSEVFPALPIANALAIVLVLLPISWHWQAKNTGTLLYIGWMVVGNLNTFINTIVWRNTFEDLSPVWCTISVKLIIGQSVGITAASLCINRKLYNIATIQSVSITPESKRRNRIVDLCLGILLPFFVMFFHYIVQPTRYNIIENLGCWPSTFPTLLAIPMVYMWPILIGGASFIYCALAIRAFLKARLQFSQVLSNSGSGINISRYFRLMALASGEMLFTVPFAVYLLHQNLKLVPQQAFISWDEIHKDLGHIIYPTPWILIKADMTSFQSVMVTVWALPAGAYLFFIWFGLGGEAFAAYKRLFYAIVGPFGIKPRPQVASVPASRWQNQLASNTSSMPSQDRARFPSIPDIEDSDEKALSDDLEAGKAHAV